MCSWAKQIVERDLMLQSTLLLQAFWRRYSAAKSQREATSGDTGGLSGACLDWGHVVGNRWGFVGDSLAATVCSERLQCCDGGRRPTDDSPNATDTRSMLPHGVHFPLAPAGLTPQPGMDVKWSK